jgi:hypothetical protein
MQLWRIGSSALATVTVIATAGLAYQPIEIVDGGSIQGEIKYHGDPPAPVKIAVTKDQEICGRDKISPSLLIGPNKGIQNAVVRIIDIQRGRKLAEPIDVTFDQKGCEYAPHVLLFPAGSRVRIRNDDGILHNTTISAEANPTFTVAQPKFRRVVDKRIEHPEMPIRVRCDVHSWMGAWWISQEHPYYALTDAKGGFALRDVPPGDYTIEAWHEALGTVTRKVTVKPKDIAQITLEMTKR